MPSNPSPAIANRTTIPGAPSSTRSGRVGYRLRKQTTALLHTIATLALITTTPLHAQSFADNCDYLQDY